MCVASCGMTEPYWTEPGSACWIIWQHTGVLNKTFTLFINTRSSRTVLAKQINVVCLHITYSHILFVVLSDIYGRSYAIWIRPTIVEILSCSYHWIDVWKTHVSMVNGTGPWGKNIEKPRMQSYTACAGQRKTENLNYLKIIWSWNGFKLHIYVHIYV